MASGHVNRANRPNTWLHRPCLQREENPCQLGAVHTWHSAFRHIMNADGRYRGTPDMQIVAKGNRSVLIDTDIGHSHVNSGVPARFDNAYHGCSSGFIMGMPDCEWRRRRI